MKLGPPYIGALGVTMGGAATVVCTTGTVWKVAVIKAHSNHDMI